MRRYAVLDVFTNAPLEGNPVAVFEDASGLSDDVMQRAARELNLSETVFLVAPGDRADARARIFTPVTELAFAGHPVLGAAFLVGERLGASLVRLETGVGVIPVALRGQDGQLAYGEMEQPVPDVEPFARVDELLGALGVTDSGLPVQAYRNGPLHVYVELPDEASVERVQPDLAQLARIGELGVSCFAVEGTRLKTRMFAPALGVPEDPATGSAAGPLAVHLVRHRRVEPGQEIQIRQGAEIGRPSLLRARADGTSRRIERVVVGGGAVLVARGEYRLE